MLHSPAPEGENEVSILSTDISLLTLDLQVKALTFGVDTIRDKLQVGRLGGAEFLSAIDGLALKECFLKIGASLVNKTYFR